MILKISRHSFILQLIFLAVISFISVFCYYCNNSDALSYLVLVLFIFILAKNIFNGISKNITYLSFLVTFFTFLLTRIFIPFVTDPDKLFSEIGGGRNFNSEIQSFINFSLFISLLFSFVGYELVSQAKRVNNINQVPYYEKKRIIRIRRVSKKATLFFSCFVILDLFDKIRYVLIHGYLDFYLNYTNSVPYIVVFLATFFDYFFIFFMATMPSKKECVPIVILYLLLNIASMGMGQRGGAVLSVMFVISYFFIRNNINPGNKPWITRKGIMALLMAVPFLISVLFLMAYIRTDKETDSFRTQDLALNFFYQQGVTVNVLGFAKDYEEKLPEDKLYSIGKIVEFIEHNIISQIIFGTSSVKPQTVDHALKDHTLHATLTYFESPNLYFSGGGYGGCYIADLWVDWGIIGIIVGNLIFGMCLAKIPYWCSKSFWKASIGLLMYTCILFSPRSNFIDFIYVFVPFTAIICFFLIYVVERMPFNHRISTSQS